jgi:hypothetical protein
MAQVQLPPLLKDQAQALAATGATASGAPEPGAPRQRRPQTGLLAPVALQEAFNDG